MKGRVMRKNKCLKIIATALFGASSMLAAHVSQALVKQPLPEDVTAFLRPAEVPQPSHNRMTPERVELGKALFFDPRLSGSNFISCATCHNPAMGWSDNQNTAIGHGMKQLGRSTPTILNTAYQRFQFWDGRARSLEQQAVGPIEAAGEMAQPIDELVDELKGISGYKPLFEAAYPGEGINKDTIAKAIASFERSVVSTDSSFDRWLKGADGAMGESALRGFELFKGKANCVVCHSGFNFTDDGFHNIGLLENDDEGRFGIKPIGVLKGAFKTPTLRDVALTAPYMHNGEFQTLEEVVEHYNKGGETNLGNLDPNMRKLGLSEKEKNDLVTFLKSLTGDETEVAVPLLPTK